MCTHYGLCTRAPSSTDSCLTTPTTSTSTTAASSTAPLPTAAAPVPASATTSAPIAATATPVTASASAAAPVAAAGIAAPAPGVAAVVPAADVADLARVVAVVPAADIARATSGRTPGPGAEIAGVRRGRAAAEEVVIHPHTGRGAEQTAQHAAEEAAASAAPAVARAPGVTGAAPVTRGPTVADGADDADHQPDHQQDHQADADDAEPVNPAAGGLGGRCRAPLPASDRGDRAALPRPLLLSRWCVIAHPVEHEGGRTRQGLVFLALLELGHQQLLQVHAIVLSEQPPVAGLLSHDDAQLVDVSLGDVNEENQDPADALVLESLLRQLGEELVDLLGVLGVHGLRAFHLAHRFDGQILAEAALDVGDLLVRLFLGVAGKQAGLVPDGPGRAGLAALGPGRRRGRQPGGQHQPQRGQPAGDTYHDSRSPALV